MSSLGERRRRDRVPGLDAVETFLPAGLNDETDMLTPLSFAGSSLAFPDKERVATMSTSLSAASFGLSDRSNSRGQHRSKSFKSSSRNNSFRGPISGAVQSLSRNCSADFPNGENERSPAASLKVFVSVPSNDGKRGEPLSKDTLNYLQEVAWKERGSEHTGRDVENRPPSPRPCDEKSRVKLHSEVLESWEDSTRFRPDICLAGPKYRRSDSRADLYQAEPQ